MDEREQFATNFQKMFNACGKKQKDFADEVGVSQALISAFLLGKNIPSLFTFKRLCHALECDYEDLLGKVDEE